MKYFTIGISVVALMSCHSDLKADQRLQDKADHVQYDQIEIPGSASDHAFLGTIYRSDQKDLKNAKCVEAETIEKKGNTEATMEMLYNMSFTKALNTVTGSLNAGANFPVVRASAGATLAQSFADTDSSKSFHFLLKVKPKKRIYDESTYRLTELGQKYSEKPAKLLENCGDAFISGIEFGGSLHANLRFDFRNATDKDNIGGKITVKVGPEGANIITLDGSLKYLTEKVRNSVKITIRASQFGGNPLELSNIIHTKTIQCTLENAGDCLKTFEMVLEYAKGSFKTQFKTLDDFNVYKYYATTYEDARLDQLVPPQGYPKLDVLTEILRRDVEAAYQKSLMLLKKANTILEMYTGWLTEEQKKQVEKFKEDTFHNTWIYGEVSKFCYDNPYLEPCKSEKEEKYAYLRETDPTVLEIKSVKSLFYKCDNARKALLKAGLVSEMYANMKRNMGHAPGFDDPSDLNSLYGFGPCWDVVPTYGKYFEN